MLYGRVVVLTVLFFQVFSEEFNCRDNQENCFWIRTIPSTWSTAYNDCTQSGGSLISSEYFANLKNWISNIKTNGTGKVWSSLHRINHHFQVLHNPYPQFRQGINWIPGHPFHQWSRNFDCVVINHEEQHENVNCNDSFPIICGISKNRMRDMHNLDTPQVNLKVELMVNEKFISRIKANHLEVDLNETDLAFTCGVLNNGSRTLEYSWIKDGVFLKNHWRSSLIPSEVNDESKSITDGMTMNEQTYQKQGTYQCQVREFGAVKFSTSNAIIFTLSGVLNGIVSVQTSSTSKIDNILNHTNVMNAVRNFIQYQNLLKEEPLYDIKEVLWDPLFVTFVDQEVIDYRNSLYVRISNQPKIYLENDFFYLLDVITKRVESKSVLNSLPGVEKISVAWATYCPEGSQTVILPSSTSGPIEISWPSSWTASIVKPYNNLLCVYESNRVEPVSGQCLANFTHGASMVMDVKKCKRVITQLETRCRSGYQWIDEMELCYKITENGSWNETMADCMNDWSTHDRIDDVDYSIHKNVISRLQIVDKLNVTWLPIRRSSIFGPFYYYSVNNDPKVVFPTDVMKNWIEEPSFLFMEEECMLLERNDTTHESHCSKIIPGVCVYRPIYRTHLNSALRNFCQPPWYGSIIQQSRLTCFSIIENESPMTWEEAEQKCMKESGTFGTTVNVSIATFENLAKTQQWDTIRSTFASQVKLNSPWIGLGWSEIHKRYCWFGSEIGCEFEHFNWGPSVDWTNGYYGIMNNSGSWDLLSISGRRNQVLCQVEIDLDVTQTMRIRHNANHNVVVDAITHQSSGIPKSFTNLSDFFTRQLSTSNIFVDLESIAKVNIEYYLDGERGQTISTSPFELSLRSSFGIAKIFTCEGWMGWPRQFVRSEPTIALRPPESIIFMMMLNAKRQDFQSQIENVIDFRQEPLEDVTQRLGKAFSTEFWSNVTGLRLWAHGEQMRMLVRVVVTNKKGKKKHVNLKEQLQNAFLSSSNGSSQLSYQVVYIRNLDYCEQENITVLSTDGISDVFNITWKSVPIGFNSEPINPCKALNGQPILRKCLGNPNTGAFWEPFTIPISNCKSATDLLNSLRILTKEIVNNITIPSNALHNLTEIVETHKLSGIELGEAARVLHASVQRMGHPLEEEQFNETLRTLTTMIEFPDPLKEAQMLTGVSNAMVKSLEQVMRQVSIENENNTVTFRHPKMTTESVFDSGKVVGYGANMNKDKLEIFNGTQILDNGKGNLAEKLVNRDVAIVLPIEEIRERKKLDNGTTLRLSFTVLVNADLFDARRYITLYSADFVVDSPIIIAQVGNSSLNNLNTPVRVFFRSRSQHSLPITPVCVFWDTLSVSGGWSPSGCQYKGRTNEDLYICECNHLTPLALLFPYFDEKDESHQMALSLISNIGCVASMVGLSLVILTFLLFRKWRKSLGNKILFNFAIALFCLTGCFLSAGLATFDNRLCKIVAAAMHYFLLASFTWMVVEGIYQYLNYVVIIGAINYKSCFMRKAGPLAWGLPILPVLGILLYDSKLYTHNNNERENNFCWMQFEALYYTVLLPVATILLFNIFIFIAVLKSVSCIRMRTRLRTSQSVQTRSWYQFRMAVCIFFLLGLAWIFGFGVIVTSNDTRKIFEYIFCILNSLQGLVIFIFFVLRERNARKLWFDFANNLGDDKSGSTSKTPNSSRSTDHTSIKPNSRY